MAKKRCGMKTKKGTRCKAYAIDGGWQCIFHAQRHEQSFRALQRSANKKRSTRGGGQRFRRK